MLYGAKIFVTDHEVWCSIRELTQEVTMLFQIENILQTRRLKEESESILRLRIRMNDRGLTKITMNEPVGG